MILTTSRKPGRKTRRFAKVLSRFFNWTYVQRGKTPVSDFGSRYAIVQEVKGNPAYLKIYDGEEVFSMRFSVGEINKVKMGRETPVFYGKIPFSRCLRYFNALSADEKVSRKVANALLSPKCVFVRRKDDRLILDMQYDRKRVARVISDERWILCSGKIR